MMKYPLRRLVRDEINSRIILARHGVMSNNYSNARIRRMADHAIILHDARYNDFLSGSLVIGAVQMFVIPLLFSMVKAAAIGAVTGSFREKLIDPIVQKTLDASKRLVGADPDSPIADVLFKQVIAGLGELVKLLRGKDNFFTNKLQFAYNKLKGMK